MIRKLSFEPDGVDNMDPRITRHEMIDKINEIIEVLNGPDETESMVSGEAIDGIWRPLRSTLGKEYDK